jgi:hypothetical protein
MDARHRSSATPRQHYILSIHKLLSTSHAQALTGTSGNQHQTRQCLLVHGTHVVVGSTGNKPESKKYFMYFQVI